MAITRCSLAGLALFLASAAAGQDLPTTQLKDHATVVRQDMTTRALQRHARANRKRAAPTASQRAACAARPRFRAQYGADHPKLLRLNGLCRSAGL